MTPRVGSDVRSRRIVAAAALLLTTVLPTASAHAATHAGAPGRLSLHSSALSFKVGTTISLTGSVTPRGSTSVTVERLAGKRWLVLGHAKPSSTGTFGFTVRAPKAATAWSVRAVRAKVGKAAALTSPVVKVRVVKKAFAVSAAVTGSVTDGSPIVVTGKISPKAVGSVALQSLTGRTWTTVSSAKVTSASTFTVGIVRPLGTYRLRVVRAATTTVAGGVSKTVTVAVHRPQLAVLTAALPDGSAGIPYSATFSATGGLAPYTWSATGLPAGLSMSPLGVLSGASAVVVHATPTITVTDAAGSRASVVVNLRFELPAAATRQLYAWGDGTAGQLGDGDTTSAATPRPVGLVGVTAATGGSATSFALRYDGSVWAWGSDLWGALADGGARSATGTTRPLQVQGLGRTVAIAAGDYSGYALADDGSVWSWGYNGNGQLGDGTHTPRSTPVRVTGVSGAKAIAACPLSAYAIGQDGAVWAWGSNGNGELGDGTKDEHPSPQKVPGLTAMTSVACGENSVVALRSDGTVWAWGRNDSYQLGDGTTAERDSPVQVAGLQGVVEVASSRVNSYAVTAGGAVWAWGFGGFGGLGRAGNADAPTPVTVLVPPAVHISAKPDAAIVQLADGTVAAWGADGVGQLGDGGNMQSAQPTVIPDLAHVVDIGTGELNVYAMTAS